MPAFIVTLFTIVKTWSQAPVACLVMLSTQEVEIERIMVRSQPRQKVNGTPPSSQPLAG
jgi:hypothetical protein